MKKKQLKKELKKRLDPWRYKHCIRVSHICVSLAMCHGYEDLKGAELAGLLHDCGKLSEKEVRNACEIHNIFLSEDDKKAPATIHAIYGSWYAKNQLAVSNEEVLQAILWHVTGKVDMSLLEKIVFVADFIEPGRKDIPGLEEIRQLAFRNLEESIYFIMQGTIFFLESKHCFVHPNMIQAYEYYKGKGKESSS